VLALPGYTPDGAALGELVRTLFSAAAPDISHTLPIQASPAPARRSEAPTRTMHEAPAVRAAAGSVSETADVRSGPRKARVVVAGLAAGLMVVAALLLRERAGARTVPDPSPAVPVATEPPPTEAAPPRAPSPVEVPAAAPTTPAASVEAVAPAVEPSRAPLLVPAPRARERSASVRAGQRAARAGVVPLPTQAAPRAVPAAPAPVASPPPVVPRPGEASVRRSANGSPIIE
jgi:hypothetical protein